MSTAETIKRFQKPGEQQQRELGYCFHLKRRLSYYLSIPFINVPLTPNQITLLSNIVQIAGIGCIAFLTGYARLLGVLLFFAGDMLDFVDGNIARYRGETSRAGVQLDQLGHVIVAPLFFAATGIAAFRDTQNSLFAYLLIFLAAGPAIVSYQLVALQQFTSTSVDARNLHAQEKSGTWLRHIVRKTISGIFHFKTEIVLLGILFERLPAVAILFTFYFPLRISLQGLLDFRRIRAEESPQ